MSTVAGDRAVVVAEDVDGTTRLRTLRSCPPVTLRCAGGAVYLAASGAGPVGGDDTALHVAVGAGAVLEVRTVSATLVLPGPGLARSASAMVVEVGDTGDLRWLPEPTVLVRGCDHRATARIDLAPTASLVWREELVLGRFGEPGGSVLQRLEIDRAGHPLLRTEHALGPRWPGSTGPAGTAGHRAVGTLVMVGPPADLAVAPEASGGADAVLVELAYQAVMVCAVAPTARALRAVLDQCAPRPTGPPAGHQNGTGTAPFP